MAKRIDVSTQKYPNTFALVDDEDYARVLTGPRWYLGEAGRHVYVQRKRGRARKEFLHRVVANAKKGESIDHINGDPLDNRQENLRICDKAQNGQNRGKAAHNTSGYKGVSRHSQTGRWVAEIRAMNKRHYLGCFGTREEAAAAYDAAAVKYHGEFARTNAMIAAEKR